jgi:hypothetical protein
VRRHLHINKNAQCVRSADDCKTQVGMKVYVHSVVVGGAECMNELTHKKGVREWHMDTV